MNNWLIYRSNNAEEAKEIAQLLQEQFDKVHFNTKEGHWGSLKFHEVRILFTDKVTAEKFVEMGIIIGQRFK